MKKIIRLTIDIELDKSVMEEKAITPEQIAQTMEIFESDVRDGFEITPSLFGIDSTEIFMLKDAYIGKREIITKI